MAAAVSSDAVTPARMTDRTASSISRHRAYWACWRAVGLLPDHPGAAEVRVEAAVADAGVDPEDVARGQRPLGAQQRAGDVAVDGPRQVGLVVGHHLPDRVEHVGLGAQLEDPMEEGGGEVGLAGARARARPAPRPSPAR